MDKFQSGSLCPCPLRRRTTHHTLYFYFILFFIFRNVLYAFLFLSAFFFFLFSSAITKSLLSRHSLLRRRYIYRCCCWGCIRFLRLLAPIRWLISHTANSSWPPFFERNQEEVNDDGILFRDPPRCYGMSCVCISQLGIGSDDKPGVTLLRRGKDGRAVGKRCVLFDL